MDEIFKRSFLEFVSKKAKKEKYREHTFVRQRKQNKFKIFEFFAEKKFIDQIYFHG